MARKRLTLRDWHRLFALLLTDYFTGSPFVVEFERDLSIQQQLLDLVIVRRRWTLPRFDHEPVGEQAFDDAVERARPELDAGVRSRGNVLDDRVAVAVAVGQRDEHMKHCWR